jgi:hypothetical protein
MASEAKPFMPCPIPVIPDGHAAACLAMTSEERGLLQRECHTHNVRRDAGNGGFAPRRF